MNERRLLESDMANSLALALVVASSAPVLLLDGELVVVLASASFCDTFQVSADALVGRPLAQLGAGEWSTPQLAVLLATTAGGRAKVDAYEMDLKRAGQPDRRLVLNARKLDYADVDNVRLLLTIADVTDARIAAKLKDDLLREKGILLQELQHRVANSLQIVASVLMQSARQVKSGESRIHLEDAHSRVMSIATLQSQLAASRLGDVELHAYFTDLCRSIGASMIRDHKRISLVVNADTSLVTADVSVSLGLIVTELVINCLKHAFPGETVGKIMVDYHARERGWLLAVSDNGIGYPKDAVASRPGLGTSLVEALATQLDAIVHVSACKPGTRVTVVHA